jgi:hypothetical protein
MASERFRDVVEAMDYAMAARGAHGVLAFLNSRVPHRFTGIYRLDPPMLRSVRLFDRENPRLEVGVDAPMRETYCSIVGAAAEPFTTPDAASDARLDAHPARESTLAYCGVPLVGADGMPLGTLCHFDLVPRPVPHGEIPVLLAAASLLLPAVLGPG